MIKYTYDNQENELKIWVDPADGSLNVTVSGNSVKVPEDTGREMINIIKDKQFIYVETERKKQSAWNRMVDFFTGQEKVFLSRGLEVGNG